MRVIRSSLPTRRGRQSSNGGGQRLSIAHMVPNIEHSHSVFAISQRSERRRHQTPTPQHLCPMNLKFQSQSLALKAWPFSVTGKCTEHQLEWDHDRERNTAFGPPRFRFFGTLSFVPFFFVFFVFFVPFTGYLVSSSPSFSLILLTSFRTLRSIRHPELRSASSRLLSLFARSRIRFAAAFIIRPYASSSYKVIHSFEPRPSLNFQAS